MQTAFTFLLQKSKSNTLILILFGIIFATLTFFYFKLIEDTCKPSAHFKNTISHCSGEYSPLNLEKNFFNFRWQSYNSTYTPNTTYANIYSAFQYAEPSQIDSYPTMGVVNTYLGGGYVFEMRGDSSMLFANLRTLESLDWIDKQTAALFLEFTLFNPNVNLFQHCQILFEYLPSGRFVTSAQFYSIDLIDLTTSGTSGVHLFRILAFVLYLLLIVVFMVVEVRQCLKLGLKYFCQLNNYIELCLIAFSWTAFAMYLYRLYSSYGIYKAIRISHTPPSSNRRFINLQYTVSCDQLLSYFLGFCVALATFRFINLFRFSKRIIVFLLAFRKALGELVSFGIIFGVVWLAFVQTIYILMNDQSLQMDSFVHTMTTCFQIILGKFNGDIFYKRDSILALFVFIGYNVCVIFVLVSLFVTILIEHYDLACGDLDLDRKDPHLYNYLRSVASSVFARKEKQRTPVYIDFWDYLPVKFDEQMQRMKKKF